MRNSTRTILAVLVMLLIIGTAADTYSRGGPRKEKCEEIIGEIASIHTPPDVLECYIVLTDGTEIYSIRPDYLETQYDIVLDIDMKVKIRARKAKSSTAFIACEIAIWEGSNYGDFIFLNDCCED